jgi:hypothetical protein
MLLGIKSVLVVYFILLRHWCGMRKSKKEEFSLEIKTHTQNKLLGVMFSRLCQSIIETFL